MLDSNVVSTPLDVNQKLSAEAELTSLIAAVQEAVWLRNLESELLEVERCVTVYCANQAAICIATTGATSKRTKHIHIKNQFVRDNLDSGRLCGNQ